MKKSNQIILFYQIKNIFRANNIFNLSWNLAAFLIVSLAFVNCNSQKKSPATTSDNATVISLITTNQTSLNKKDVINYFCSNLTEYFNTYKYYKISSEIYTEKEKQNTNSTSQITKHKALYTVEYIGSSGKYSISFSTKEFAESNQIFTFARGTILGNGIRKIIYDTYLAWLNRIEINLKASYNSYLYPDELEAAIELEKWYNSLN